MISFIKLFFQSVFIPKKSLLFFFCLALFFFAQSQVFTKEFTTSNDTKVNRKQVKSQTNAEKSKKALKKHVKAWGKIPLHHNGRIKPFSSYAREFLLLSATRTKVAGESAAQILNQILFTPQKTFTKKIFRINHPESKYFFSITDKKAKYFSFNDLRPHFEKLNEKFLLISEKENKNKTPLDRELSRLYHALNYFYLLSKSFTFFIPTAALSLTNDSLKKTLSLNPKQQKFSLLEIVQNKGLITYAQNLQKKKGPADSLAEKEFNLLLENITQLIKASQQSPLFFLPLKKIAISKRTTNTTNQQKSSQKSNQVCTWHTLWEIIFAHNQLQHTRETKLLEQMVIAYRQHNFTKSQQIIADFQKEIARKIGQKRMTKINLENFYNQFNPFYWTTLLYGGVFLFMLFVILFSIPFLQKISFIILNLALFLNICGLVLRILIVGRPPVTNLYETFLFITAIVVTLALIMERFFKNGIGILTAAFLGLFLLLTSNQFAVEGDTLGVLVAVLRSNFWLATHVITITIGYAAVILAGGIAHFYLFHLLKKKPNPQQLKEIFQMTYAALVFGLIFSFIGTVLGGIWADQSWGRFWGWDPKENGALLIVLWCSILLHGRISGLFKELGFCVGSVLGIIVVMMSWFGINLLGVGLHSYGFTSGLSLKLFLYIWLQLLLLLVCLLWLFLKENRQR